jgi:hypothetical protein
MQIFQRREARIAILATALALAGCPAPLERPEEQPPQYSYRVASTPYAAAICIGRNAKARGQSAEERTYGESGMEVIVRGSGTPLATARIVRDGTFSSVSMTVTPQAPGDRGAFSRALMAGC